MKSEKEYVNVSYAMHIFSEFIFAKEVSKKKTVGEFNESALSRCIAVRVDDLEL